MMINGEDAPTHTLSGNGASSLLATTPVNTQQTTHTPFNNLTNSTPTKYLNPNRKS